MILKRINRSGRYNSLQLAGCNKDSRNKDIGILFDLHLGETVIINRLDLHDVFVPIIKIGKGRVIIEDTHMRGYGGDGMNVLGDNMHMYHVVARDNTPTRPYGKAGLIPVPRYITNKEKLKLLDSLGEKVWDVNLLDPVEYPVGSGRWYLPIYHVDGLLQSYDRKGSIVGNPFGSVNNISIDSIDAQIHGRQSMAITLSEKDRYKSWVIGTEKLHINMVDRQRDDVSVNINTVDDFILGGRDNQLDGKVLISDRKGSGYPINNLTFTGITENIIQPLSGEGIVFNDDPLSNEFTQEELLLLANDPETASYINI